MDTRLEAFIARAQREHLPTEGILWAEGENILWEHHFTPDVPRNIYSHTKSFTMTAAGLAADEGKLSLEDKPADFFPESVPDDADKRVFDITLRDVITMSSGFSKALLMMPHRGAGEGAPDYLRYLFSHPVTETPGSKFCYSNGDTYLAGRMAEKATGEKLENFLARRIFRPLGIAQAPEWEHCPMGHAFGASGLRLTLRDMSRLGSLYLGEGVWQGKRILSKAWIEDARRVHIATADGSCTDCWNCGYGYQLWKLPYGSAYRFDGAYGQFTCIFPEKNLVVSVQDTESDRTEDVKRALHEEIFSQL